MYSSFIDQFYYFTRYIIAFLLVFVVWPQFIFKQNQDTPLEGFFRNFIEMVFLLIVIIYLLVLLKLYELLSLGVLFLLFMFYRYHLSGQNHRFEQIKNVLCMWLYDFSDGLIHPWTMILKKLHNLCSWVFEHWIKPLLSFSTAGTVALFLFVFIISAYLRFYDAFVHAAPAMSDAYVTLAWMKYIEGRVLFHDGIYPQGFHIILSVLRKFSALDGLYVLKYSGPLNGVLITLGLYFFTSRITGKAIPGLMAAFIYGVIGNYLPLEWQRQASTNSQEFGFVFLFPAWCFLYNYLRFNKRRDFITASTAMAAAGLVHTLAFLFVVLGFAVLIGAVLIINWRRYLKTALWVSGAVILAGVISVLPAGVGLLAGKKFHGAASDFLVSINSSIAIPSLDLIGYGMLGGAVIFFLYQIIGSWPSKDALGGIFILGITLITLAIYLYAGVVTKSVLIAARSCQLYSLVAALVIGAGWYVLYQTVRIWLKRPYYQIVFAWGIMIMAMFLLNPVPALPYKMEYDSSVEQYLRISRQFRPTEWMIVSQEEGYALALGTGYHLMMKDFLNWYHPGEKYLTRWVNGLPQRLTTPDVFIFHEKKVFQVELDSMKPIYARRKRENYELTKWLKIYRLKHKNLSIFYEDNYLQVIRIHQELTRKEVINTIWG